jgi:hypothetical protein
MNPEMMLEFFRAYNWLQNHPAMTPDDFRGGFPGNLCTEVVLVNPLTDSIDDDESLNISPRIWLECGPCVEATEDEIEFEVFHRGDLHGTHDIDLDCGGDTFEEAIIELARLFRGKYGDYVPDDVEPLTQENLGESLDGFLSSYGKWMENSTTERWDLIKEKAPPPLNPSEE